MRIDAVLTAAMIAFSCTPTVAPRLAAPPGAASDVVSACRLAAQRCSRCHTIDRILLARVESPVHWRYYVARMRRQPRSGISESDARTIVRCLVARSFGPAAADALEEQP